MRGELPDRGGNPPPSGGRRDGILPSPSPSGAGLGDGARSADFLASILSGGSCPMAKNHQQSICFKLHTVLGSLQASLLSKLLQKTSKSFSLAEQNSMSTFCGIKEHADQTA